MKLGYFLLIRFRGLEKRQGMGKRLRMRDRYRRFSFLTDIEGMKNALGEMRGLFFPDQPSLNTQARPGIRGSLPDEAWFVRAIEDKVAHHPDNAMEFPFFGERIYGEPLVGFVRGDDPIFPKLKEVIGPHHFTPWEIMARQARRGGVLPPEPGDISVVSFVLPFTKAVRDDNAAAAEWASERWAQGRLLGEMFSQTMVREMVASLMYGGILAVSPDVTPEFGKKRYPGVGWASPWSHRHIAYAAGLGTFGMHDFLITEKGCAVRVGSFVVNLRLEPNRSRPDDIHAHCLHYQGVKCLRCAARCPAGAITAEHAHDKEACYRKVASSLKHCNENYHIFIYGCGLCSTGVPCQSGIPGAPGR
jgi:epoxyqueuosine reductase